MGGWKEGKKDGQKNGTHKEGSDLVGDGCHTHPKFIQGSRAEDVRVESTLLHQWVLLISACQGQFLELLQIGEWGWGYRPG